MALRSLISAMTALLATSVAISPAFAQRGHGRDNQDRDGPRIERVQRGAFPSTPWDQPQEERAPQRDVPLGVVLRDLEGRYGGQHLDAQKVGSRYIISWITKDGRRLTIEVDASTGRVLSTR